LFLFDFFRSYLPLHNPIGFGAADFVEFAIAATLVVLILFWNRIMRMARGLSERSRLSMAVLFALPIVMRLALLPHYPVPTASGSDDFSYLLLGDTLRHLRLANPVHPMHQFFESIFVLQDPSYSSIFPLGQGIVLTLGWAGVLITAGLFCALVYWMLRAWTEPIGALLGGLLAVAMFGPLCEWMNSYWGGYLSGCAGCLVFGSLPRKNGWLLGLGIAIQWLTRPFECVLLVLAIAVISGKPLVYARGSEREWKWFRVALIPIVLAAGLSVVQNCAVTKSCTTMPYILSRYQYGVPAGFTFQPNPEPHRALTTEQQLDYEAQSAVHDSAGGYWQRLVSRFSFYRFFLMVPLFISVFVLSKNGRILGVLAVFALGTNFYPYFYPHYIAAVACLLLWMAVSGLSSMKRELARCVVLLCAVHGILWYGLHLAASQNQRVAFMRFENWDFINYGDPDGRIAINRQLERLTGKKLVFVRYGAGHGFHEWIHNEADIDSSKVVWAADLGEEKNEILRGYYKDRTAFVVEPDAQPPRLAPYQ
jgi:hypothetical protein